MDFKPYYRKEKCEVLKIQYKSMVDIAKEFIEDFNAPAGIKQLYVLMDSWYTSQALIETALSKGYHLIGGIKSNRAIYPCGIKLKISEFTQYIDPNTLDVVTVRGKKYSIYRFEGKIGKFDNAILLISYEVKDKSFENPVFILCTDIDLETQTILEHYSIRWNIETSYQYLKENLGFDQYRVRSRISITRYFFLCFLAYNFLEIYRVTQVHHNLNTIGDTIKHHRHSAHKSLVDFIYYQARNSVPLEGIYQQLKLTA
jgi:SRSO17 transposase